MMIKHISQVIINCRNVILIPVTFCKLIRKTTTVYKYQINEYIIIIIIIVVAL